jgi:hypothetical protein
VRLTLVALLVDQSVDASILKRCLQYQPTKVECADASENKLSGASRNLGLLVCRGTNVTVVIPENGMQEIENPFGAGEGDAEGAEATI